MTEHEKLKVVQPKSQAIHEFIEWLGYSKGITLHEQACDEFYENNEEFHEAKRELGYDFTFPIRKTITQLVAEYYDIDLKKLEDEKLAMIEEMRRSNEGRSQRG